MELGKTTVLNLIGGMDSVTDGKIIVDGKDISKYNERKLTTYRGNDIGFVFQFYNLIRNLTAKENVELATIKLLGFYNRELSSYVFRENIILTIIGGILGLILGVYLNFFVISTAEVDMVMFGRETTISSYILAFLITIVFATLINLIMNKELRKIDMIESLKSVE